MEATITLYRNHPKKCVEYVAGKATIQKGSDYSFVEIDLGEDIVLFRKEELEKALAFLA